MLHDLRCIYPLINHHNFLRIVCSKWKHLIEKIRIPKIKIEIDKEMQKRFFRISKWNAIIMWGKNLDDRCGICRHHKRNNFCSDLRYVPTCAVRRRRRRRAAWRCAPPNMQSPAAANARRRLPRYATFFSLAHLAEKCRRTVRYDNLVTFVEHNACACVARCSILISS